MTNPQPNSPDQNPFLNAGGDANMQQGQLNGAVSNQYPAPANQQMQQGYPNQQMQQGYPNQQMQQGYPGQQTAYPSGYKPKSKVVALLLCFFLGSLGIHNFYLGNTGRGIGQILLFFVSVSLAIIGIGILTALALGLWVLIEFIMIIAGSNSYATELS